MPDGGAKVPGTSGPSKPYTPKKDKARRDYEQKQRSKTHDRSGGPGRGDATSDGPGPALGPGS